MKWTSLNDLREIFLSFFASKGHSRLPSFPLVPQGDKSLLLINSGMAPLKKYFTGELVMDPPRATTCQKCIRTPDIENVGKTARHGTFFEMLGNFSFGDYFKREACAWAWEFITQYAEMDPALLYISVFAGDALVPGDTEAYDIWTKEVGIDPAHMVKLGRADNFWDHGSGPCGPCSEIYYDRGANHPTGHRFQDLGNIPAAAWAEEACTGPGCDCDRYMEFWNLVFTQFDNDGHNNYTKLAKANIDTGMGLERLACLCQGVDNLFEVDTVRATLDKAAEIAGVAYHADEKKDVSLRVITDHTRSTCMMVSDGVLPSNEGRGYVLRRLLRRAARHGRLLGITRPFLAEVAETVIGESGAAYPNLSEKKDFILQVIAREEEAFARNVDAGMNLLEGMIAKAQAGQTDLSGEDAFLLSDTFGFPVDLTREILEEAGLGLDEDGFKSLARQQRERSRAARKGAGADAWKSGGLTTAGIQPTVFLGYGLNECEAKITAIYAGGEATESLEPGQEGILILDETPFYAESGGQAADTGTIAGFAVTSVGKTADGVFLHHGAAGEDGLAVGQTVTAAIDVAKREKIRRNHTAAHLLHAAMRSVLGSHVEQAGQSVTEDVCRFDFTHFSAVKREELQQIETLVNRAIWDALPVETLETTVEEAKAHGAMALFGEKYGDIVRMVRIGAVSAELCGGTHAHNSGALGLFRILSESSVAGGVRRIEAVTAQGALEAVRSRETLIQEAAANLKAQNPVELPQRAAALVQSLKDTEKALAEIKSKQNAGAADRLLEKAEVINGITFVYGELPGATAEDLRTACDNIKGKEGAYAALFAAKTAKGTLQFAACAAKAAVAAKVHAGNLARAAAQASGGSGGGKPDSAMAGGKDPALLADAFEAAKAVLAKA
ncbi:MAG: alanine--tRNA ligase [Oscillospiraceae bacterium]|jgi:alanyl-tRNA synthetase|nr:alanine--tRNA ligase [Oscillospiraceae bacterium]